VIDAARGEDPPRTEEVHHADTVVREGEATVFLADGVEGLVGARVLDAEGSGTPPRLVLRSAEVS